MSANILVVEDDAKLAAALRRGLEEEGFTVSTAANTREAQRHCSGQRPDLLLLDLTLPGQSGLDWLADQRTQALLDCPVIMVTARGTVADRLSGFRQGADDYVVKPFAFTELVARIQAVLKRARQAQLFMTVAGLKINLVQRTVERGAERIELTAREYDILLYLARHAGRPVSRDTLAREVWHVNSRATPLDNVIDVSITRLRRKIDVEGGPSLISTLRGLGYKLVDSP